MPSDEHEKLPTRKLNVKCDNAIERFEKPNKVTINLDSNQTERNSWVQEGNKNGVDQSINNG